MARSQGAAALLIGNRVLHGEFGRLSGVRLLGFDRVTDGIRTQVEALHRRVIRIDRVRLLCGLTAAALVVVALAVAVDAMVRWPMVVRVLLLAAGLTIAVRAVRRVAERGWFRTPGASSVALRIEGVEPSLRGVLASAYEFERSGESRRSALADSVVRRAVHDWRGARPERHVRWKETGVRVAVTTALCAAWIAFSTVFPGEAAVGLRRTLTPWSGDLWPARVSLQVETPAKAVARGASVPLKVRVTRGDDAGLRVRAVCRSRAADGSEGGEREFDLARQVDGVFERPVVAEGERMRVRFVAGDAETETVEIAVVTPPSIERGSIEVRPPAYAAADHPALQANWQGVATPDAGSVLAGSEITLRLDLGAATDRVVEGAVQAFDDRGQPVDPPGVAVEQGTRWRVNWIAGGSTDLVIRPIDAQGVQAPEALRVAIRVTPDNEPTVSVTEPEADEAVTPEAVVPFRVEARDDLGLASIGWRLDRQQRSGEPAPVQLKESARASTVREDAVTEQLSLPSLQAKAGDTLLLRGLAKDRMQRSGMTRATVLGDARKIRVVERETFERQVRQQVAALREAAARLEASQQEISRESDAAAASRSEAGLSERVHQGNESAQKLVQRLKRNGLQDLPLTETLREAARLGGEAEREAGRAQDALRRVAAGAPEAMQPAREAQKATETALREMVDLLDRDDDAAASQRRADRLAEGIAKLREDLRQAARPAAGKSPEELTPQERQAMQEQAARQRTVADEAAAMIEDLRARAERIEGKDRAQAKSLRQAAEEGERGQASRRMDEAADRTDRNQATAADEAMKAAAEAVDRVRDALREDRRARTEDLKRRLASLAETLQGLVAEGEATLRDIEAPGDAAATRLLQLSRNTGAAAEEARAGDRALQKVAGSIERAAERFEAGVKPLRSQPADAAAARDAVSRGIDLLREALKGVQEAQQREQEKAAERERAQLERQYRELAAQARSVREATAGTLPPAGGRVDRRGAAVQREQGQRVQGLQRSFDAGPKSSETVRQAATFTAVHARVDRELGAAREALESTRADGSTVRRLDLVAESFDALAAALADPEEPEDPFADAAKQAGEAGGAGGAQPDTTKLPPIAELRLVRQLQQQVLQITRTLDEARSAGAPVEAELRDLAAMQDEVRRLGEDWIRRMEEKSAKGKRGKPGAPETTKPVDAYSRILGMDDGATTKPGAAPAESVPVAVPPTGTPAPAPPPRTLDELLGIGGATGGDEAARMQRERQLRRSLNEEDLDDLARAATESMDLAATLVRDRGETGLGTQRVQRQAVESLDALIDAATRFNKQQQQQQKGSKSRSKGQKPSSGAQSQQADEPANEPKPGDAQQSKDRKEGGERKPRGTTGDSIDPPPPEDAAVSADGTLVEGRSEWGRLPRRIREIMSQARRDRISAIYQQATEAYYRRMAEEKSP